MLDQKLAEAMQRILSRQDERFTLTATLQRLVDDGIGTKRGKSVYFYERDRQAIREWLEAKGFSIKPVDMSGMSRAERLDLTPHEKAGGETVKRNRISIKALAGQALVIGGQPIDLPEESHLDVDWTNIVSQIDHRCIMVVENYENFNRIHETSFKLPVEYHSPLVVYRGDPYESRIENVLAFLEKAKLPVMAFVDADLAGIVIAASLPWFVGMLTPDIPTLSHQLSSPQIGRRDLFQDQYPSFQHAIVGIPADCPCSLVLDLILKYRSAVVQERWIGKDACIITFQSNLLFPTSGHH